jgi:hypothetical protein
MSSTPSAPLHTQLAVKVGDIAGYPAMSPTFPGTKVTDAGARDLGKVLPGLKIER